MIRTQKKSGIVGFGAINANAFTPIVGFWALFVFVLFSGVANDLYDVRNMPEGSLVGICRNTKWLLGFSMSKMQDSTSLQDMVKYD